MRRDILIDTNHYVSSTFGSKIAVNGGAGNDTIRDHGIYSTINGGDGDDTLDDDGYFNVINGGDGDDVIISGDHSTLTGGTGNDTFRLLPDSSNPSFDITDLTAGDSIVLNRSNTNTFTYVVKDDNMILTDNTGDLNITLEGVTSMSQIADVEISLRNKYGTLRTTTTLEAISSAEGVKLNKAGNKLTVRSPFNVSIRADDYGNKIKSMNASSNKNTVELIGNKLDNVIKASKGGSTLNGGGGDDKITCNKGVDVIVYEKGDGHDTIKKFGVEDRIVIADGEIDSVELKGKNVVLNVGEGSLKVQTAVGKSMTLVDADGVESTYVFTKQNNDLESALLNTSTQLSTNDYWFEQSIEESPLNEIMSEEAALDLSMEIFSRPPDLDSFQPSVLNRSGRKNFLSPFDRSGRRRFFIFGLTIAINCSNIVDRNQ